MPNRAEFGDLVRNQLHECRRLGVDDRVRRRRVARAASTSVRPDARHRGHRRRAGPPVVGAAPTPAQRRPTCGDGARRHRPHPFGDGRGRDRRARLPPGHVASPSCWPTGAARSRSSPTAWSSARTSASPSTWRTGGCGPRPRASCSPPTSCRWAWRAARCSCCTTRPASTQPRTPDWVVLAVPGQPRRVALPRRSKARRASSVRAGRRLRGAPPGPRRGDRGRPGRERRCDRASCPCAPARCRSAATRRWPSAAAGPLLVGDGHGRGGRRRSPAWPPRCRAWEAAGYAPAAWAAALAPVAGRRRRRRAAGVARRPRPRAPPGPRSSTGRCSPAPSRCTAGGATRGPPGRPGDRGRRASTGPFVATLQPGRARRRPDAGRRGAVGRAARAVDRRRLAGPRADAEVLEVLPPDAATMDLAEAPRIVGGGAGLDGRGALRRSSARSPTALGASVGATRVVTDRGWVPPRAPDRHDRRRRRPRALPRLRHQRRGAAHQRARRSPTTSSASTPTRTAR